VVPAGSLYKTGHFGVRCTSDELFKEPSNMMECQSTGEAGRYDKYAVQLALVAPRVTMTDLESSVELLRRAKAGDADALNRLMGLYLVPLRNWARGRLPRWVRDVSDTQDIVQDSVVHTLKHLSDFQPTHDGALHAYLRTAVMNRIRDELRRVRHRPARTELVDEVPADDTSPFDQASTNEALEHYEAALSKLRAEERELIIARVDFGLTYEQIANALGRSSANAVRVAVRRALVKVTAIMQHEHDTHA
jgi:RNA polymerase sigma-70 factor (ECF subfamily)